MTLNLWEEKKGIINNLGNFLFLFHSHYFIAQSFPLLFIVDFGTWLSAYASLAFSAMCATPVSIWTAYPTTVLHSGSTSLQPFRSAIHPQSHTLNLLIEKLYHGLRLQYYWSLTTPYIIPIFSFPYSLNTCFLTLF